METEAQEGKRSEKKEHLKYYETIPNRSDR